MKFYTIIVFFVLTTYLEAQTDPCNLFGSQPYHLSSYSWNKSNLKYYFKNFTPDLTQVQLRQVFQEAFNKWAAVTGLVFTETTNVSEADITIRWHTEDYFYNTTSTFAVAYYPPPYHAKSGDMEFNENIIWMIEKIGDGYNDLRYVALHELGHILGLCHSGDASAVMYYPYSHKLVLSQADIDGITKIYLANITAQNNFIYGTIKVGINTAATQRISPYPFTPTVGNTVNLEAQEQNYGGYNWIWNDTEAPANPSKWEKVVGINRTLVNTSISHSFTVATNDNNSTYEAGLRRLCNLSFIAGSGTVYLNYNSYSSPKTIELVEQNSVEAFATNYTANGLDYTFLNWDNNPSSNIITATAHNTYTAIYSVRPSIANRNQQITSSNGQYITLQWNANPNPYVYEYRVYRKIGHTGTPSLIATTSNTTFTDPDYIMTGSSEDKYLMYDVRPVYSVNQSESVQYFQSAAFGRIEYLIVDEKNVAVLNSNLPKEYSISNYPNPFNPTTKINYQIPESGFVTLKVYDILGKEVATLVNENKQAGYHSALFTINSSLSSGIYIYTIQCNGYKESRKMLLAK